MSQIALGQRMNVLVSDIRGSYCPDQSNLVFSSKMSTARFLWVLFNCHGYDYKFWKCRGLFYSHRVFNGIHKLE